MIASLRERLGSKLAAHRHHGLAPATSWFQIQVDTNERLFVMAQTLATLTAEMFRFFLSVFFGGPSVRLQATPFPYEAK